jgi:glycogen operon protein
MIEFRKNHAALRSRYFFNGMASDRGLADVSWHGCQLNKPGWTDPDARALAMTLGGFNGDADIHVMMNMYWDDLAFDIPPLEDGRWFRAVDTAETAPRDIADPGEEPQFAGTSCTVRGRSIVVLVSRELNGV